MYHVDNITKEDALHVLFHFSGEGVQPGGFTNDLINAAVRADQWNQMKLSMGFPGLIAAIHLAKNYEDGLDRLRTIAEL